jgi:hypothetical protein
MVHIVNEVDEYIEHTHKQHIPLREKITKAFDEFLVSRALSDPASLKKLAQSFVNVRFKDRKSSMQNSVFYQVIYQAAQKKPQETARFLLTIGLTEKELGKPVEIIRYFLNFIATHMEPVPYEVISKYIRQGKQSWHEYIENNSNKNASYLKAILDEIKTQAPDFFEKELFSHYKSYLS